MNSIKGTQKKPVCIKTGCKNQSQELFLFQFRKKSCSFFFVNFFAKSRRGSVTASIALFTPVIIVNGFQMESIKYRYKRVTSDRSNLWKWCTSCPNGTFTLFTQKILAASWTSVKEHHINSVIPNDWKRMLDFFTTRLMDKDNSHVMTASLILLIVPSLVRLLSFISRSHTQSSQAVTRDTVTWDRLQMTFLPENRCCKWLT